jgi:hypothetical protein
MSAKVLALALEAAKCSLLLLPAAVADRRSDVDILVQNTDGLKERKFVIYVA